MIHLNACSVGVPALRTQQRRKLYAGISEMVYIPTMWLWLASGPGPGSCGVDRGRIRNISYQKHHRGHRHLERGIPWDGGNCGGGGSGKPSNLFPWFRLKYRGFRLIWETDGRGCQHGQYLNND